MRLSDHPDLSCYHSGMRPEQLVSASEFEKKFPFQESSASQIQFLLEAATRAPSTHNCQPWRFRIEDNRLFVYRDTRINLPQSDPQHRYAYISIGFLLYHIMELATWLSMAPLLSLVLKDDGVAEVVFESASPNKRIPPKVSAIFTRRNRRGVFKAEPIPHEVLDSAITADGNILVSPEIKVITDPEKIRCIADATATVMRRVYANASFRKEMSNWITPSGTSRKDGIPGYSLNISTIASWILPTLIHYVNIGNVLAKINYKSISSAPTLFGYGSSDDTSGWVSVGFAASRAALTITAKGLDYSVFVASIEYEDTRQIAGETFELHQPLQFLFAAGSLPGKSEWMTPRMPVEQKLITP